MTLEELENKINAIKCELKAEIDMRTQLSIEVYSIKNQIEYLEKMCNLLLSDVTIDADIKNKEE